MENLPTPIIIIKKIALIAQNVVMNFYQNSRFSSAAALAYTTLLSIVPLLAVSFFILTSIPPFEKISNLISQFIFANFVTSAAQTVQQHFQHFINQAKQLPVYSLIFLLITAVLLIFSMEQVFNNIWHVKTNRKSILAFILYTTIILIAPILIGAGLIVTSYLISLPIFGFSFFRQELLTYFPYLATLIAFILLYIMLPNRKVPFNAALIAAIIATILFEIAKYGFAFYIIKFANYRLIYGALATIPIFLVWLYVCWVIILFGTVISYEIANCQYAEKK